MYSTFILYAHNYVMLMHNVAFNIHQTKAVYPMTSMFLTKLQQGSSIQGWFKKVCIHVYVCIYYTCYDDHKHQL